MIKEEYCVNLYSYFDYLQDTDPAVECANEIS